MVQFFFSNLVKVTDLYEQSNSCCSFSLLELNTHPQFPNLKFHV